MFVNGIMPLFLYLIPGRQEGRYRLFIQIPTGGGLLLIISIQDLADKVIVLIFVMFILDICFKYHHTSNDDTKP
jgi:hypothetical protein